MLNLLQRVLANRVLRNKFQTHGRLFIAILLSMSWIGCSSSTAPPQETTSSETAKHEASPVEQQDHQSPQSSPESTSNLNIGDTAPLLQIANWIKGTPVESYEENKIYVVEFWATWCPPCRAGMPHLSKLQETYGEEVTFIGVTNESSRVIENFLQKEADLSIALKAGKTWNDLMRYTVASDDSSATSIKFMRAAEESGIPCAFIVGFDGRIEWIGHPGGIDGPLEKITQRSWDREGAKNARLEEKRQTLLQDAFANALRNEDWEQALQLLPKIEKSLPSPLLALNYRFLFMVQMGRTEEAIKYLDELASELDGNAAVLNRLAWSLVTNKMSETSLVRKALSISDRAAQLTGYADRSILDTLARAHFVLDDLDQAILWQKKAIEADPDNEEFQRSLQEYTKQSKSDVEISDPDTLDPVSSEAEET